MTGLGSLGLWCVLLGAWNDVAFPWERRFGTFTRLVMPCADAAGDAAAMTTRARAKMQHQTHDMPLSQGCTISPLALTPLDFNPDLPPQSFYLTGNPGSDGLLDMLQPLSPHMSAPSTAPQEGPLLHPDEMLW